MSRTLTRTRASVDSKPPLRLGNQCFRRMSNKSALKAVRTALDSKDFEDAAEKANDLVKQEPQIYHAYVVLRRLCCLVFDPANFNV